MERPDPLGPIDATLRVIYGDTDQMGVVYYANYFRYFEFSRSEYFRARGGSYQALEREGYGLPVIQASCEYKAPAKYEDLVRIRVALADIRRASLRFGYEVFNDATGALLCTGSTVHACVLGGKPARLPQAVMRLLTVEPAPHQP